MSIEEVVGWAVGLLGGLALLQFAAANPVLVAGVVAFIVISNKAKPH